MRPGDRPTNREGSRDGHVHIQVGCGGPQSRERELNRKQFVHSHGATCANWTWSWSFVNHPDKFVIFGIWKHFDLQGDGLILAKSWVVSPRGRKQPGYPQALEHLRLVREQGYRLYTFPMTPAEKRPTDDQFGPAKISGFDPTLTPKTLMVLENGWYATPLDHAGLPPDEIASGDEYWEGALRIIQVNAYERNAAARQACLSHFGVECQVCRFDFERVYGELGRSFIHVHHVVPLSEIGENYQVDPVRDLVPVCPNCHAMIHKPRPALSLQELREQMRRSTQVSVGLDERGVS